MTTPTAQEWLDEIESELDLAPMAPDWRQEVQRLCRAVRELTRALEWVLATPDELSTGGGYQRLQEARATLERWNRGGLEEDTLP